MTEEERIALALLLRIIEVKKILMFEVRGPRGITMVDVRKPVAILTNLLKRQGQQPS